MANTSATSSSRKITTSLENWDFQKNHVQNNLTGGDFVGSHGCVLCATAPRLEDLSGDVNLTNEIPGGEDSATHDLNSSIAIPIGVIDTATMQQDRQMAQIYEIGSKRSYILSTGRIAASMSLARVFYKGPNLLRMLYAFYPAMREKYQAKGLIDLISAGKDNILHDFNKDTSTEHGERPIGLDEWLVNRLPAIKDDPGFNNVWMNLASDIFSQPCGLILFIKDNNQDDVAAVFLEECYIQTHGMQISANSVLLAENSTLRFERAVPIKVKQHYYQNSGSAISGLLNTAANPFSAAADALGGLLGQ